MFSRQLMLEPGLTEPTPLEQVDVTITELGFLEAGWRCLDNAGMPEFLHPILVQVYGCSDVYTRDGRVVKCDVILGTSSDYIREHELRHCEGYTD
jgi:hypothetical protein